MSFLVQKSKQKASSFLVILMKESTAAENKFLFRKFQAKLFCARFSLDLFGGSNVVQKHIIIIIDMPVNNNKFEYEKRPMAWHSGMHASSASCQGKFFLIP